MKLYKYKSIDNLWHILDIVLMNRLFCAHWSQLNDPLEGRYTVFLQDEHLKPISNITGHPLVDQFKDATKIASLSADGKNFLLWSHYASGHRGVVIEFDIPDEEQALYEVRYSPFDAVINNEIESTGDYKHVLLRKTEAWSYEKEYRILYNSDFYPLDHPPSKIIFGGLIDDNHKVILSKAIQGKIEFVNARINRYQGWVEYE